MNRLTRRDRSHSVHASGADLPARDEDAQLEYPKTL
jgi:hypothetical protein